MLERLRQQHPGLAVIGYGNSGADVAHLMRCDEASTSTRNRVSGGAWNNSGFRCVQWH